MHNKILSELNAQCPVKTFKRRILRPPYLTDDLLEQIKDRDYFYKKAKRHGNEDDWEIAKYLRNLTNKNIRKAKSEYIIEQLNSCGKDNSKFWRVIRSVFPSKQREKLNIRLKKEKVEISPDKVADFINDFFINVGNAAPNLTTSG